MRRLAFSSPRSPRLTVSRSCNLRSDSDEPDPTLQDPLTGLTPEDTVSTTQSRDRSSPASARPASPVRLECTTPSVCAYPTLYVSSRPFLSARSHNPATCPPTRLDVQSIAPERLLLPASQNFELRDQARSAEKQSDGVLRRFCGGTDVLSVRPSVSNFSLSSTYSTLPLLRQHVLQIFSRS